MSSCYIVSSWGGRRRKRDNPKALADGAFYLREHIGKLASCKNIDRIVVAAPKCPNPTKGYEEYLRELEARGKTGLIPVEVFRRANIGLAYGSYNDVYGRYRTQFDSYFVAEDDYIPAVPGLDGILLGMMKASPKCGFLCGLVWPVKGDYYGCAAIFLGVLRTATLEKIWARQKCLARFTGCEYLEAEEVGQLGISRAITAAGYEIQDWTARYSSPFWYDGVVKVFGNPALPPLYALGQTLGPHP